MIRLSQVHLKVRELEQAIRFYTRVLGFDVIERVGRSFASLAFGTEDSLLALHAVGVDSYRMPELACGLGRISFEVTGEELFASIWERLWELRIPVHPGDDWMKWSLHFEDSDGNAVELYVPRRRDYDRHPWKPFSQRILRPVAAA